MKAKKGFTLIELMVVVVIVAILAAIVIPLLLSRVEKAKYSEGKAIASQVATAIRAYAVEADNPSTSPNLQTELGFKQNELDAKYFLQAGIQISNVQINADGTMNYTIRMTPMANKGLNSGDVVLECIGNQTNFTSPVGL